ncbi:MAG: hypothetical protein ACK41U_18850 [Paracoccus sp. (in: a-proteobacteria)]|uniref:hypothetical protein n=1 Tax=Paracoccus sp. TaxID=267 RepID=UPI00391A550A
MREGQRKTQRTEPHAAQATQHLRISHEKPLTAIRTDLVAHRRSIQQLQISVA